MSTDQTRQVGAAEPELSRIAHGAGLTFAGKIADSVLQYLHAVVIANLLGGELFGLYMLGFTVVSIAAVVARLGLDAGVVRYVSLHNGVDDKARVKGAIVQAGKYAVMGSTLVVILLMISAGRLSSVIFGKPELARVIILLAPSVPFLSLAYIALCATTGFKTMRYVVYFRHMFLPMCNLVLFLGLFAMGYRIGAAAIGYVLAVFLTSLASLYSLRRVFPEMGSTAAVSETKTLLRFSIPLLLVVFIGFVIQWTDILMIGHFRSSKELGVYSAGAKTAMFTCMALACLNSIFSPIISDLYNKQETSRLHSLFKAVTKWSITASIPVFLLIVLLSSDIMRIFGSGFTAGSRALVILAFGQMVNAGVGSVGAMLVMSGRQDHVMYTTLGVCLLNIVLNYFLIPAQGIVGAAIATSISIMVLNVAMLVETYVLLGMHPYSAGHLKPVGLGLVTLAMVASVRHVLPALDGPQSLLVYAPVFLAVFALLVWKFAISEDDEFVIGTFRAKLCRSGA
jgi:O-antigen/teichoic acid export membrane protein